MADEQRETEDPGTDEMLAEEQPEAAQLSTLADEHARVAEQAGGSEAGAGEYEEPAPELGNLN